MVYYLLFRWILKRYKSWLNKWKPYLPCFTVQPGKNKKLLIWLPLPSNQDSEPSILPASQSITMNLELAKASQNPVSLEDKSSYRPNTHLLVVRILIMFPTTLKMTSGLKLEYLWMSPWKTSEQNIWIHWFCIHLWAHWKKLSKYGELLKSSSKMAESKLWASAIVIVWIFSRNYLKLPKSSLASSKTDSTQIVAMTRN